MKGADIEIHQSIEGVREIDLPKNRHLQKMSTTPQAGEIGLEREDSPPPPHIVNLDEVDTSMPLGSGEELANEDNSSDSLNVRPSESLGTLCIKNKAFSREAFYAQALLIYIIAVACIINLSIGSEHSHVWVSLLSASLGFILPAPKVRGPRKNTLVGVTRDMIVAER